MFWCGRVCARYAGSLLSWNQIPLINACLFVLAEPPCSTPSDSAEELHVVRAESMATAAASPLTTNRFFNRPAFRGQRTRCCAGPTTVPPLQGTYRSWQLAKQGCSKNPNEI